MVIQDVCRCQVHILSHRQVQLVAGLVGIHDVLVVLKTGRIALSVVEREVYIVGKVGKHVREVGSQSLGNVQVGLGGKLGFQLSGHVGNQSELVLHLSLLTAIAQIIVDSRTSHQRNRQNNTPAYCRSNMLKLFSYICSVLSIHHVFLRTFLFFLSIPPMTCLKAFATKGLRQVRDVSNPSLISPISLPSTLTTHLRD